MQWARTGIPVGNPRWKTMPSKFQLLNPLKQAAAAFFRHDVVIRRVKGELQFGLEQRNGSKAKAAELTPEEQAKQKAAAELALIREQLAALLSETPQTRRAMRALVAVERGLEKKGLRALRKMPLDVLKTALEQFEALVLNWSPAGLANLRSKMAVTIMEREGADPEAEADAYRTAAVMDADDDAGVEATDYGPDPVVEDELAAAYAMLVTGTPSTLAMHPELGSPSAKAVSQSMPLDEAPAPGELQLREIA